MALLLVASTSTNETGDGKIRSWRYFGHGYWQAVDRSPLAEVMQLPHWALPLRHAQVGVAPQPAGSALHANVPGFVAAPPVIPSQNCAPCMQKRGPHANIPVGGGQPPLFEMS